MRHAETVPRIMTVNDRLEVLPHPLVEMRGISKYFGRLRANHDIRMSIYPGRVKAILGENGAGKSTLMSVLAGRLYPDAGSILIDGKETALRTPKDARLAGIGMVYQHFMLVESMTVTENVLLGHEDSFVLRPRVMRARVDALSKSYGLEVNLSARVSSLSMGERQRVEILKLLCRESRVLIFDEPTAVLTPGEAEQLFKAMRVMAGQGKAIVFISHKLPEVLAIADEIAILRRGEVVDEFTRSQVPDEAELAHRMLGRAFAHETVQIQEYDGDSAQAADQGNSENTLRLAMGKLPLKIAPGRATRMDMNSAVLSCVNVCYGQLREITFTVLKGDILAIVGVAGNGQKELVELVCGGKKPESGSIRVLEEDAREFFRRKSGRRGLAYIPEERKDMASCARLDLVDNFLLTTYNLYSGKVLLDRKRARRAAEGVIDDYSIYPPDCKSRAAELSGGNLQKLIIGRELMRNPACIVAENPTQGLDIAATEEVWRRLRTARESSGILLVTGDLAEALALADHIGVMYRGRIVDIFGARNSAKVQKIGMLMAGSA